MYIPEAFSVDPAITFEIIDEHPFGILCTPVDGKLCVSHLPFVRDGNRLIGHLARANPHAEHLGREATGAFSGPDAYISPRYYRSVGNVPTWNFEAVHVSGPCRVITDAAEKMAAVDALVSFFEAGAWSVAWNQSPYSRLLDHITAFELDMLEVTGKRKMSQNKSADDIQGAIEGLEATERTEDRAVAELMRALMG